MIVKIWEWLRDSHRIYHLLLGMVYGLAANGWYCALYGGVGVAGAMEFKDWQWGGRPDVWDFLLTLGGVAGGYGVRALISMLP